MDKNAIKKFAVWARTELRDRVTKKIDEYAISADADPNAEGFYLKMGAYTIGKTPSSIDPERYLPLLRVLVP